MAFQDEGSSKINLRNFVSSDECSIIRLFNSQHENLGGFVPRTVEYWRWCCLTRPDVEGKGIQIAEQDNKIAGYVVVGKSGNVWELCYDLSYNARTVVSLLLNWAANYARNVGSDSIVLNAYVKDQLVSNVCREMDFGESPSEPMFLSVLDLPQLLCEILQDENKTLNTDEVFWFKLKNCPSWCISSFGVRLGKDKAEILEKSTSVEKTTIVTEMSTLVSLIFGKESVSKNLITAKVHFYPFWRFSRVRRLLNLLQNKTPWFFPRADMG